MAGAIIVWCVPPVLLGVALFWAAKPAVELGGVWSQLRRAIVAVSIVTLLGPLLALYQLTEAVGVITEGQPAERAAALAQSISEAVNLGAFVFIIGFLGQLASLAFVFVGRRRAHTRTPPVS